MKPYIKLLLILFIPLVLVVVYAKMAVDLPLQKICITNCPLTFLNTNSTSATTASADSLHTNSPDSTIRRILFFGDSMCEGLAPAMSRYARQNGYKLYSVCWYSSTTDHWAKTDTLDYFLRTVKPDYVIVSIGGNEQFVSDLDHRRDNIRTIQHKIGSLPVVWICTPEWQHNARFNIMLLNQVGRTHFFDSRRLTYERKQDHAHPTIKSSEIWMDSIAVWLQSPANAHPIPMTPPHSNTPSKWHATYLSPATI